MPSTAAHTTKLQCFKPGSHLAMSGVELTFAQSDLAATAGAYDPALHEAPLVVGHPKLDAPAYGWVEKLEQIDGALEATPRQVNPEFAAIVNAGAYKKMSAAFWAPDAPGNPVPGVYYLRHIGFLGAQAPAVPGLRTPAFPTEFAGGEEGVVEFSEWDDVTNASLWRSLRDWVLGKFGKEDADAALPDYMVSGLQTGAAEDMALQRAAAAATATNTTLPAAFAQPNQETPVTEAEKAALEAENARLRQQLADNAAAARQTRLQAAHAEGVAFADGLVAQRRVGQDRAALVVAVFDAVAQAGDAAGEAAAHTVNFAQGDKQVPLLPALRQWLAELPPLVAQGQVATTGRAAGAADAAVAFAAPAGATLDEERLALHGKALEYQRAHPGTTYVAAVAAVS